MSQISIINKLQPNQFYIGDRALMRDTRLSADAKNIYHLLVSMAQSCQNVAPSQEWIAQEIGYNIYNEDGSKKSSQAISKFIKSKTDELVALHMVVKSRDQVNIRYTYEVYEYKSAPSTQPRGLMPLNPQVECTVNLQV